MDAPVPAERLQLLDAHENAHQKDPQDTRRHHHQETNPVVVVSSSAAAASQPPPAAAAGRGPPEYSSYPTLAQPEEDPSPPPPPPPPSPAASPSPSSSSSSALCCVYRVHRAVRRLARRHRAVSKKAFLALLFLAYLAYFAYCMHHSFGDEGSVRLLGLTVVVVLVVARRLCPRRFFFEWPCWSPVRGFFDESSKRGLVFRKIVRWTLYILATAGALTIIIVEVAVKKPENLISLLGLAFFIIISFFLSSKPERINWHAVFWGMMLQFWFAVLIQKTHFGTAAFVWLSDRILEFLKHTDAGSETVFGVAYLKHPIVFAVMPTIIFFNAMISMSYYIGLIQVCIATFGKFLSFCIGTSPIESINAAANLFLSLAEAPILTRPFMNDITNSELFAVLTGGFASIAGSLLWAFAAHGAPVEHILTASVMSAPAALAFAKLIYPDERKPTVKAEDVYDVDVSYHGSMLGAAANGAKDGLKLCASVVINLLVYIALLEFLDHTVTWFAGRAGLEITFSKLVSYIFYPITYLMGFPAEDCLRAARLLAVKILTTTMQVFMELGIMITNAKTLHNYVETHNGTWSYVGDDIFLEATNTTLVGGVLTERSGVLATYMVCGLSNLGAVGVAIGVYGAMAPGRISDITKCIPLALLAANFACFSTACVAGLLLD